MAVTSLGGRGMYIPELPWWKTNTGAFTSSVIDATGEKTTWVGNFWHPDGVSKNIVRLGFLLGGTLVKAGGSNWTASLQSISHTTTTIPMPDETQDETVVLPSSDVLITANAWYRTDLLSSPRTLAIGEQVAAVLEFDGSGRLGVDSISTRNMSHPFGGTGMAVMSASVSNKTAGSWSLSSGIPTFVFECDDGTFGCFGAGVPLSDSGATSYSINATPDEWGNRITLPFDCTIDGVWWHLGNNGSATDHEVIIYSGTTALKTIVVPGFTTGSNHVRQASFPPITVSAGDIYITVRPTVGTIQLQYEAVANANHMKLHPYGINALAISRVNQGAWDAVTNTRRYGIGVRLAGIDYSMGGGGGIIKLAGFGGGLVG